MLRRLRIENLVLIRAAELEPAPGLNAITGETGAGKTILAQAIGLLLGARGDAALVGPDGAEAYVEAELDVPDGLLDEEEFESLAELRPAEEDGLAELRTLAADTEGLEPSTEDDLRAERERLRHVTELAAGAAAAAQALVGEDDEGAATMVARAERAVAPLERLTPELARAGDDLRDAELRLRETASELRTFLETLDAEPGRLEHVEAELARIAATCRRFRCTSYAELLDRAAEARAELGAIEDGFSPAAAAADALAGARHQVARLIGELSAARREAAPRFAAAVAEQLTGVGLGAGEFHAEVRERD